MSETILTRAAQNNAEHAQPYPTQTLAAHDSARLAQFTNLLSNAGRTSLEGEPIYADSEWNQFHAFTHDVVIPEVASELDVVERRLDVLYDDCTVSNKPFNIEYYLTHIADTRAGQLPLRKDNESAMLERGKEWVGQLQVNGHTSQSDGITRLDGDRQVALTTGSGRPSCAVLDAVYQMQKAEDGIEVAILVHNTSFRGQQLDMQTVLRAMNGNMPFQYFGNIYVRQRKGALRLASMQIVNAEAKLTEVK